MLYDASRNFRSFLASGTFRNSELYNLKWVHHHDVRVWWRRKPIVRDLVVVSPIRIMLIFFIVSPMMPMTAMAAVTVASSAVTMTAVMTTQPIIHLVDKVEAGHAHRYQEIRQLLDL